MNAEPQGRWSRFDTPLACACGAPVLYRVEHEEPSTRGGLATHHGPYRCPRCADREAGILLAQGVAIVVGRRAPDHVTGARDP